MAYAGSRPKDLRRWLIDPELHCLACYRFGRWARRLRHRHPIAGIPPVVVHRIWNRWTTNWHHCDISEHADIGPGLILLHRIGVLIGPAVIGRNCRIHHNVTIGERVAGRDHGIPRVGDNVWIGPGAVITGSITIGDDVTISAGTVLSRDVPPRSLVAGNPGRVIARDYDNSSFLTRGLRASQDRRRRTWAAQA